MGPGARLAIVGGGEGRKKKGNNGPLQRAPMHMLQPESVGKHIKTYHLLDTAFGPENLWLSFPYSGSREIKNSVEFKARRKIEKFPTAWT